MIRAGHYWQKRQTRQPHHELQQSWRSCRITFQPLNASRNLKSFPPTLQQNHPYSIINPLHPEQKTKQHDSIKHLNSSSSSRSSQWTLAPAAPAQQAAERISNSNEKPSSATLPKYVPFLYSKDTSPRAFILTSRVVGIRASNKSSATSTN